MRKQIRRKLSLNRETLRSLQDGSALRAVVGGTDSEGTQCRTACGSCPPSACHPSLCPDTCDCC
jgi:hypothetical protein